MGAGVIFTEIVPENLPELMDVVILRLRKSSGSPAV